MKVKPGHPRSVLIIGCGDIGLRTAALFTARDIEVHGAARTQDSLDAMQQQGITPHIADLDMPETLASLPVRDTLLYYFAPPARHGTEDTRMHNFLASLDEDKLPAKIVYLSTSGVYGDQQGQRITEQTTPAPAVDRARRRFDAEQQLRKFVQQKPVELVILRVGGIYGPGRLPEKRLRDRVPIIHEELAPRTNRIHADDLARTCEAAGLQGQPGEVYNISDGTDSNMTQYFKLIADHLGLPHPPEIGWEEAEHSISPGMMSYLRESRHMDNSKMLHELGVELRYPTLQSWLATLNED